MDETTDRFGLPLLQLGQAQKEVFHNEALTAIDLILHASAVTMALDAPPAEPEAGRCWIVGGGPGGEWAGHAHALAAMTAAGWRFAQPRPGMLVWIEDVQRWARWDGAAWRADDWPVAAISVGGTQVVGAQQPAIADPVGGTTVDTEARAALADMLAMLRSHGLIAT